MIGIKDERKGGGSFTVVGRYCIALSRIGIHVHDRFIFFMYGGIAFIVGMPFSLQGEAVNGIILSRVIQIAKEKMMTCSAGVVDLRAYISKVFVCQLPSLGV